MLPSLVHRGDHIRAPATVHQKQKAARSERPSRFNVPSQWLSSHQDLGPIVLRFHRRVGTPTRRQTHE